MTDGNIARIAVEGAGVAPDRLYDYLIPDSLKPQLQIGYRVLIPYGSGKKLRQGFVFDIVEQPCCGKKVRYKNIYSLCDQAPLLSKNEIELALWLCDRTFCTPYEAAKAQLPSGFCMDAKYLLGLASDASEESLTDDTAREVFALLKNKKTYLTAEQIYEKTAGRADRAFLDRLVAEGVLITNIQALSRLGGKTLRIAELTEKAQTVAPSMLTAKQRLVLDTLRDLGSAAVNEICYYTGVSASVIFTLENKGLLLLQEQRQERLPFGARRGDGEQLPIQLTDEQQQVFERLQAQLAQKKASCSLLFGVTGSGKTSVYTRLIDEVVAHGGNSIVMVPEISLTPQTLALFYKRYGEKIAVFHSGLSAGERIDEWRRVKEGVATIAIGTRSAVFAPFDHVDFIIIDEEQEHTYKSERAPRYHAAEVAKYLCARDQALLLLASATPSVETYAYAKNGRYELLALPHRYGEVSLPKVEIIDVGEGGDERSCLIGSRLSQCLADNLRAHKQAILLMNRRGYHTFVACASCKSVITCPSCSISLTYHQSNHRLMCHYCGYSEPMVEVCPVCGKETVRYSGCGTQRIEEELCQMFPSAKILRMDADTTMAKNAYEQKLRDFADGKYDIMIGTQMVAKGLDFPNVTLVGVLSADIGLYLDDYRSAEKAFDLLTQVIGRAGRRSEQGLAVIQTLSPDNEVIRFAAAQDYQNFFNSEIANRKAMIYPPFCDICMIGFLSENELGAKNAANAFLSALKASSSTEYADQKLIVIGPNPSVIRKMGNQYRFKLLIKCKNSKRFRGMIRQLLFTFSKNRVYKNVKFFADMNPASIF